MGGRFLFFCKDGGEMPNEKNLIPLSERTTSEQREIQSKGGKASGASRRRKRDMAKAMKMLLDMPAMEGMDAYLKKMGLPEMEMTNQMAMLSVMLVKAASGDVRAAEFVRDTSGCNPKIRLEEKRFEAEQEASGGGTDVVSDWISSIPDVAAEDGGDGPDGADDENPGEEEEAP